MLVTISLYDCVKCGTLECGHLDSWNKYVDECDLRMQIYWFGIDVLGGAAEIGPSSGRGQTTGGTSRWFPPFSRMMFVFRNDLLMVIFYKSLLNEETMMKCLIEFLMIVEMTMKCRTSSYWMLKQWWKC